CTRDSNEVSFGSRPRNGSVRGAPCASRYSGARIQREATSAASESARLRDGGGPSEVRITRTSLRCTPESRLNAESVAGAFAERSSASAARRNVVLSARTNCGYVTPFATRTFASGCIRRRASRRAISERDSCIGANTSSGDTPKQQVSHQPARLERLEA